MTTQRPGRVQEALRQEISRIVHQELRDPRLGFLTITRVEITKDLRYAKVYFSTLGTAGEKQLALKGLNSAKGYMKGLISERIKLRFMPEIDFRIDGSMDHAKHINELLDKLRKEKSDETGHRGDKEA